MKNNRKAHRAGAAHRYTDDEKFRLLRTMAKGTPLSTIKREQHVSRHTLRRIRDEALQTGVAKLVIQAPAGTRRR